MLRFELGVTKKRSEISTSERQLRMSSLEIKRQRLDSLQMCNGIIVDILWRCQTVRSDENHEEYSGM